MIRNRLSFRTRLLIILVGFTLFTITLFYVASFISIRNTAGWLIERILAQEVDRIISLKKTEAISEGSRSFILNDKFQIIKSSETDYKTKNNLENSDVTKGRQIQEHPIGHVSFSFTKYKKNEEKMKRNVFKRKFYHFRYFYGFDRFIAIYRSFEEKNQRFYAVIISPLNDFLAYETRNHVFFAIFAVLSSIIFIYLGSYIAKKVSIPLSKITEEAHKIQNFELENEININSNIKEIHELVEAIGHMKKGLLSFKKYIPEEVVRLLLSSGKEAVLGGARVDVTVFFSDIENFTNIAEKLDPEVLVEQLGVYFQSMTGVIQDHGGIIDKYIGDAVMAFWGVPRSDDHAIRACRAALAAQKALVQFEKERFRKGDEVFPFTRARIGLNTGSVVIGNIGHEERMNYTIIGDAVNLSSRLEALNKNYGTSIIIGEETHKKVKNEMRTRLLDYISVKGKKQHCEIYELIGDKKDELSDRQLYFIDQYEASFKLYLQKDFKKAKEGFEKLTKIRKGNKSVQLLLERCNSFINLTPQPYKK